MQQITECSCCLLQPGVLAAAEKLIMQQQVNAAGCSKAAADKVNAAAKAASLLSLQPYCLSR